MKQATSIDRCETKADAIRFNAARVVAAIDSGLVAYNKKYKTQISARADAINTDGRDGRVTVGLRNVGVLQTYDALQSAIQTCVSQTGNRAYLGERCFGAEPTPTKFVSVEPEQGVADVIDRLGIRDSVDGSASGDGRGKKRWRGCRSCCWLLCTLMLLIVLVAGVSVLGFGFVVNTLDQGTVRRMMSAATRGGRAEEP